MKPLKYQITKIITKITFKASQNPKVRLFARIWFIKILIALFKMGGGQNYLVMDIGIDGERYIIGMARKEDEAFDNLVTQLIRVQWPGTYPETYPEPEPVEAIK